jgi:hypothetical protein
MPLGYQCSNCGDAHKEEFVHDVVVKIANVYVKGVYDECGGVEIQVESNTPTYCSSILAYPMQFAPDLEKWNIPHDSLLATEIYCNGKVHQEPTRQLQMYLLKQKQQSRYCIPPHVRIQDALHVWHLASLPKALPSNNKNTRTGCCCCFFSLVLEQHYEYSKESVEHQDETGARD